MYRTDCPARPAPLPLPCQLQSSALAVLLALCCLAGNPAFGQDTQPAGKTDTIRGTVVNRVTHEPVGRALVFSQDNRFAAMTDSEGHFEFILPAATGGGDNRPDLLLARKPGFLVSESHDQHLQFNPAINEVTIPLMPEALIVGRIALPTAEASARIEVEIYRREVQEGRARWVSAGIAQTRSNGEFRFAELVPGAYKLFTHESSDRDPETFTPGGQLYGYPPVYYPAATDFSGAGTIQLTPGAIFQADLSLLRQPYYPVKVAVANALPGDSVEVGVSVQGRRGPGYSLGYDQRNQAIVGSLPNGNYALEASSFGRFSASGWLNLNINRAALEGPRMTLVTNGSIRVNLKEEFTSDENTGSTGRLSVLRGRRNRLRGQYLNLRLETGDDFGEAAFATLRHDDSLVIEMVQPGRYWVLINSSRGYASSVTSGGTDLQHEPLVVGPGGSSPPIEITMRDDFAQIEGSIEGSATVSGQESPLSSLPPASPVSYAPFAFVYCVPPPDSSGQFMELVASPDGGFSAPNLPPGVYRVLAFKRQQPELEYRNPEAMRAYDAKGPVVRLVAGQKETVRLPLISASE